MHRYMYVNHCTGMPNNRIFTLESAGKLGPCSRFHKWKLITYAELGGFLALIINVGIFQLPDIESYWKTLGVCQVPFFRDVLS